MSEPGPTYSSRDRFTALVERELVAGELRRVATVAITLLFGGVSTLIVTLVGEDAATAGNLVSAWATSLFVLGFAAVEGGLWLGIRRRVRQGRPPQLADSALTLVLEVTGVIVIIGVVAVCEEPLGALNGPGSLLIAGLILASVLRLDPRLPLLAGVVGMVEYGALTACFWPDIHAMHPGSSFLITTLGPYIVRAGSLLALGVIAAFVAREIRRGVMSALEAGEERRRVVDLFSQQVSPEVVDKLMSQAQPLESELRTVCVMFLDIRNFTRFSESRAPGEVVAYLNLLFDRCVNVVNAHGGIINKFLGDGFMALFGAPVSDGHDARNAVSAALEIIAAVDELVASDAIAPTRVGIGLHRGEVVVGNVGSHKRREYTAIGDTVNTAARIEALNKQLGSVLLLSDAVRAAAPELTAPAEAVEPMAVKGRAEPVRVYRLA